MPYQYNTTEEGYTQYNLRKMSEMPHALTMAGDVDILKQQALLNFDFLYNKLNAFSLDRYTDLHYRWLNNHVFRPKQETFNTLTNLNPSCGQFGVQP